MMGHIEILSTIYRLVVCTYPWCINSDIYIVGNKVYEFILTKQYILIQSHIKLANSIGQSWTDFSGESKKHML